MWVNLNDLEDAQGAGAAKRGIKKMQPSITMLLKTNGEKMSIFRFATMFMKTGVLCYACQDVDERIGSYQKSSDE
jgi:hypothetical protein